MLSNKYWGLDFTIILSITISKQKILEENK